MHGDSQWMGKCFTNLFKTICHSKDGLISGGNKPTNCTTSDFSGKLDLNLNPGPGFFLLWLKDYKLLAEMRLSQ